jgi:hypothetical protein
MCRLRGGGGGVVKVPHTRLYRGTGEITPVILCLNFLLLWKALDRAFCKHKGFKITLGRKWLDEYL